ncbi:hypothetical protein K2X89_04870 [Myxococcota bacterium]|nr:hypothetical protein [Myxococcota bacterium]
MPKRPLVRPGTRMLNHVELSYAPGERRLAKLLLQGLGFRVLDPQTDEWPENLGPAATPFLIVYIDPAEGDVIDNVIYASEALSDQWRLEQAMRDRLTTDPALAELHEAYRSAHTRMPQAMTHFGIAFPSGEEVEAALERIAKTPELEGRVELTRVYRPGEPGAVDDRVIQAFVYTDVVSTSLLFGGQQIELQVRLDGA